MQWSHLRDHIAHRMRVSRCVCLRGGVRREARQKNDSPRTSRREYRHFFGGVKYSFRWYTRCPHLAPCHARAPQFYAAAAVPIGKPPRGLSIAPSVPRSGHSKARISALSSFALKYLGTYPIPPRGEALPTRCVWNVGMVTLSFNTCDVQSSKQPTSIQNHEVPRATTASRPGATATPLVRPSPRR